MTVENRDVFVERPRKNRDVFVERPRIMEWTHPLLTGLAMGHDEVVESHLERGWVHYEDYNHRFGYR
ncbi:hypothetical protein, partial [Shewanella algae]|uniref:hypothetical protein n=1 Tax=Shewanella algae TaxID=38313 RepID=UPI001AAC9181